MHSALLGLLGHTPCHSAQCATRQTNQPPAHTRARLPHPHAGTPNPPHVGKRRRLRGKQRPRWSSQHLPRRVKEKTKVWARGHAIRLSGLVLFCTKCGSYAFRRFGLGLRGQCRPPDAPTDTTNADVPSPTDASDRGDTDSESDSVVTDGVTDLVDGNDADTMTADGADTVTDPDEAEIPDHVDCYALPDEEPLVIMGDLADDGPTWNLPNTADCSVESDIATTPYQHFTLCKTTSGGEFDLRVEGGRDRGELTLRGVAVFVYSGARLPEDPTTCVGQTHNVEQLGIIENLPVSDGEEILLMATSFVEGVGGTYQITITRQPE